jgi:hypothetical protein
MQPDLSLNPFITSHLPHLMNDIQELAISQYVVPFVSVRLQVLLAPLFMLFLVSSSLSSKMIITKTSSVVVFVPKNVYRAGACNHFQHVSS